ncbi:MAG: response regulator transcription factor [Candidatus Peregrinibacteria bacterium]|nr:response regulator transcription factor [Candidatus Peregrinibacteria bacterium]
MKILLIEDEIELANFLIRGFKYEGYHVDHLMDGEGMADYLNRNNWDVIILDLILPSKGGESILKEMRMRKDTTPVIVLTAIDDIETKTKILNLGADDYLVKPFSFVELVARIKSILRRSAGAQKTAELTVGDLCLNPDMRLVKRGQKSIKLRLKEYVLLEYFMQNPDKVINRNTLIESVWDYNARLLSNTVDSHISLLRKKINHGFKEKLIETIHGVGYILRSTSDQ